jgi:hypothetical protein
MCRRREDSRPRAGATSSRQKSVKPESSMLNNIAFRFDAGWSMRPMSSRHRQKTSLRDVGMFRKLLSGAVAHQHRQLSRMYIDICRTMQLIRFASIKKAGN